MGEANGPFYRGMHHAAFRCRDAAQTLWFYRDVIGLEPAGAVEIDGIPGSGHETPYLHIFFDTGAGDYLAFFDSPDDADPAWFAPKDSFDMHIALQVDSEAEMNAMRARIKQHGVRVSPALDHDFVRSIYMYDPNGIQLEITVRTPDHDAILAAEKARLPEMLADWSAKTRDRKVALFGERALAVHAG